MQKVFLYLVGSYQTQASKLEIPERRSCADTGPGSEIARVWNMVYIVSETLGEPSKGVLLSAKQARSRHSA